MATAAAVQPVTPISAEKEREIAAWQVETLFSIMRERGVSQSWLARQLGVSRGRVWNWAHGVTRMPDACQRAAWDALVATQQRERTLIAAQVAREASQSEAWRYWMNGGEWDV